MYMNNVIEHQNRTRVQEKKRKRENIFNEKYEKKLSKMSTETKF
jgi:hypothetical protein